MLIHLDYSFLEDAASPFANGDENIQQSDEEIVLGALDSTADEKLTGLALRIILSDHLGIPHEGKPDLLMEAEQVFVPKKSKTVRASADASTRAKPTAVKAVRRGGGENESCLTHALQFGPDSSGAALLSLDSKIAPGDTPSVSPGPSRSHLTFGDSWFYRSGYGAIRATVRSAASFACC